MRRLLRWSGRLIMIAIVVAIVVVVWRWDEFVRLYRVNTLFDEQKIVANFSKMDTMFPTAVASRGGDLFAFGSRPVPLPESFEFRGQTVGMEEFLSRRVTTSLVVVQADSITHESYLLGTGPEDRRMSWSVAKSVLSALVGIAMGEGAIRSLDDPIEDYVPEVRGGAYEGVTLRNALNMASGVAFGEDYLDYDSDINQMGRTLALGGSMDEFAATWGERADPPGEVFRYASIDTHVVAMVLRAATGKSLPEYFAEKVWSRIGPEADAYYVTDKFGHAFALGGLNMRSRDYARIGRLMMNGGKWGEAQIVPPEWVAISTRPSAPPGPGAGDDFRYGLHWWMPPDGEGEFLARGIYGQFLYVDPARRVVIVKTSADPRFSDNGNEADYEAVAAFRAIAASVAPPATAPAAAANEDTAPADGEAAIVDEEAPEAAPAE